MTERLDAEFASAPNNIAEDLKLGLLLLRRTVSAAKKEHDEVVQVEKGNEKA